MSSSLPSYAFGDYEPLVMSWWQHRSESSKQAVDGPSPHKCHQAPVSQSGNALTPDGSVAPDAQNRPIPYTVIMPPPNVTGSLHLGHALSLTYQDILVRYHRMMGQDVQWIPGTDHAGIATQMMVEKALAKEGLSRQEMGREAFMEHMWTWKEQHGHTIIQQMHRMGFAASWDQLHFTLDPDIHHSVMTAFVRLHEKGLIYRAQRLVHWDSILRTALSDLEVVNQTTKGHLWHLRYTWNQDPSQGIVVATTRPETLFADQAIMVHPEDSRYAHWIGRSVHIPLSHRLIPVIADDSVDMDKGTGAVKVTPGHDSIDFEVGRRHGLATVSLWDESLCYNEHVPLEFRGMPRDKARAAVLETLGENLVATENIEHQVPLSERSGCIVEPLLTWQWFVDMESMADKALQAIESEHIRFYPSEWANNAKRWLENIQPWCVSRQLWWGHRLPVWYGPNHSIYVAPTETQAYAKAHIDWGADVVLTQDNDVLDTWFSSGLWPMATLGWPCHEETAWHERLPTNILVTGFDILFFWVARMMMLGLEMTDRLPFHEVYIHPLIRDAHGQKMSKTKNNVVNPLALIDDYGADAVRFALASATSGKQHMKFAIHNVDNAKHFVTKVINVFKFARLKGVCTLESFDHKMTWDQWPETIHHPINGWIRNKTAHMLHEWQTHITQYRFSEATLAVYQWVWREVCDVYIEWVKKLLDHPEYAAEVRQTLTCVLGTVLRVLHPIMPFVTDFVWHEWSGSLGDLESMPWPTVSSYNVWMEQCMDDVQRLMTGIRAQRSKESLPKTHLLSHALSDLTLEARQGLMHWQSIVQDWVGVSIIP